MRVADRKQVRITFYFVLLLSWLITVTAAAAAERLPIKRYTTADGLLSNQATCITEDQWGMIYIGTGRGGDRLDPANGHIKPYTTADGLASNFINVALRDRSPSWAGQTSWCRT